MPELISVCIDAALSAAFCPAAAALEAFMALASSICRIGWFSASDAACESLAAELSMVPAEYS